MSMPTLEPPGQYSPGTDLIGAAREVLNSALADINQADPGQSRATAIQLGLARAEVKLKAVHAILSLHNSVE